jgi:hypothetical protein
LRDDGYHEDRRGRRGRAAEDDFDGADEADERPSFWRSLFGRNLGDTIAVTLMGVIAVGIAVNALVRQNGPHPAPLFATAVIRPAAAAVPVPPARPADVQTTATVTPAAPTLASAASTPVQARPRAEVVADIQRELTRRRIYDGAVDGLTGPKTDAAIRRYEQQAGLRPTGEASEAVLGHMRRPSQRTAAAPAAPARPAEPQTIGQLLERERPQPRPTAAPPARPAGPQSIGDLITADTRPAGQRQR